MFNKFRLGDEQDSLINRPVINLRVEAVNASDNRWHKFVLFQVSLFYMQTFVYIFNDLRHGKT